MHSISEEDEFIKYRKNYQPETKSLTPVPDLKTTLATLAANTEVPEPRQSFKSMAINQPKFDKTLLKKIKNSLIQKIKNGKKNINLKQEIIKIRAQNPAIFPRTGTNQEQQDFVDYLVFDIQNKYWCNVVF